MFCCYRALLACLVVGLLASAGNTQPQKDKAKDDKGKMPDPFEGPVSLLKNKSVQKELKLTAKQVQQVAGLDKAVSAKQKADRDAHLARFVDPKAKQREQFRALLMDEVNAERRRVEGLLFQTVLMPAQLKRFNEIRWQQQGPLVVSAIAGFPSSQTQVEEAVVKGLELTAKQQEQVTGLFRADFIGKAPTWKDASEKFLAFLTDAQKDKWKEMQGEPFAP